MHGLSQAPAPDPDHALPQRGLGKYQDQRATAKEVTDRYRREPKWRGSP
jgi:hypothetical protein